MYVAKIIEAQDYMHAAELIVAHSTQACKVKQCSEFDGSLPSILMNRESCCTPLCY